MTLVFADTETTGLDPDGGHDEIWEFAAVRRENNRVHRQFHAFVKHNTQKALDLPEPFLSDYEARYDPATALGPVEFLEFLGTVFARDENGKRVHLVGAVPDFDTAGLRYAMCLPRSRSLWHYHLIDVETLMVGWLAGRGIALPLPWNSDDLSKLVGVDPKFFDRHTAMGDVAWTMANYDAVMS